MVYLLVLAAGMLLACAQGNDIADDSPNQGFLSKYMSFESDASKATLGDYKKFVTPGLNPTKHGGGSDLLSHRHGLATDDSQHVFDLQKIADEEEEKAVQKLLANHSNMKLPMQLSAIGVAYLALLAMLRVRMRRGTTAAAGNILELKTQESSVRGQVGWSQQSSKNSRPLTLAMASEGNTPVAEAPEVKAAPAAEMDFGDQAAPDNTPEEEPEKEKPQLTERQKEIARLRAAETFMEKDTGKFQCRVCELEYDPEQGNAKTGIAPGTQFQDIQSNWRCPQCRASKDSFSPMTITIAGFAENQGYGFGGNSLTEDDKNLLIFGGIGFFFVLLLSGYLLT